MLSRLLKRARDEQGFTLIELMVVVLIIGILVAIALPTFLGARTRAQNRAAQSDLRNILVAAKTIYTDNSSYALASSTAGQLDAVEPGYCYVATGTASVATGATCVSGAGAASVSVNTNTTVSWAAARMSASGACFFIKDTAAGGTTYGQLPSGSATACSGTQASALGTALSWS